MRSMTGYGRVTHTIDGREATIEVKSVNHRFLDLSFRMPRTLGFAEEPLRKTIGQVAQRGHFDLYLAYANRREDARVVEVDEALLQAYRSALSAVKGLTGAADDMTLSQYAALPDVLRVSQQEDDRDAVLALLTDACVQALSQLCRMREAEGGFLQQDMQQKLDALSDIRAEIQTRAPQVIDDYQRRLHQRLTELLEGPIDPQRIAQEVALFADRATIDEELVRLGSHIAQMQEAFQSDEAVGRRLDFLVQELNREVNTIGSKSQDTRISALVIEAKGLVEKLREQVQNVE